MNKILIVEDEDCIRGLLAELILSQGHGVRTAANGREALDCIATSPKPTLILLDLRMPGMGGEEFLVATRSLEKCNVPILIITAETEIHAHTLQDERIIGVLKKPFTIEELVTRLSEASSHRAACKTLSLS